MSHHPTWNIHGRPLTCALLISCERDGARCEKTLQRMRQDVPSIVKMLEVFPASDASAMTEAQRHQEDIKTEMPGSDGCALSLKRAWRQVVASGREWCIVLEDDVIFHERFEYFLPMFLARVPADAGILWLGYCSLDGAKDEWWFEGWPHTTHAYIVSKRAATDMLADFGACHTNVDLHLQRVYERRKSTYAWKSYCMNHQVLPSRSPRQLPCTRLGVFFRGLVYQDHGDDMPLAIHRKDALDVATKKAEVKTTKIMIPLLLPKTEKTVAPPPEKKRSSKLLRLQETQQQILSRLACTPAVSIYQGKWDLVVTHCEEDLSWLANVPSTYRHIYIYHRGASAKTPSEYKFPTAAVSSRSFSWKVCANVGRESGTILEHCLDMKKRHAEVNPSHYTVFTQSDPKQHPRTMFPLRDMERYLEADYRAYTVERILNDGPLTFEAGTVHAKQEDSGAMKSSSSAALTMRKYYQDILGRAWPSMGLYYSYCNIFGVRNYRILAHGTAFYERALLSVSHHANPKEGHYFERLTRTIFGGTSPFCPADLIFQPIL